ncbi:hypothetical protein [Streptomyces flaveolus]|uniref:hypothetical protein n=1 Tax=Streptomyces flaveolus TaxID=67297 RepID=UPI0036A0B6C4
MTRSVPASPADGTFGPAGRVIRRARRGAAIATNGTGPAAAYVVDKSGAGAAEDTVTRIRAARRSVVTAPVTPRAGA